MHMPAATRSDYTIKKTTNKIKYHEKFKKVLPIQKLAKFYQATREFKKLQSERKKQNNYTGERKR